jgi:hypothetical protein
LSLAYFTTKLARISCPIAFHAIREIIRLDSFIKTSIEDMFPTGNVDVLKNKILFLRVVSRDPISRCQRKILRRLGGSACSFEKGSLGRDMPSVGMLVGLLLALTWQGASALLELSSSTSSS